MFDTLYSITITQAAAALRAGELTSAALVRHALEAVRLHDGTLNAMLRVSASALEEAERCDAEAAQGSFRGPLHGIPLVIKDNIDVRGLPTTVASPLFTHAAPAKADAVAVAVEQNVVHPPGINANAPDMISLAHRLPESVLHLIKQSQKIPVHMVSHPHLAVWKAVHLFQFQRTLADGTGHNTTASTSKIYCQIGIHHLVFFPKMYVSRSSISSGVSTV